MKTDTTGAPYPRFIWNHAVHEAEGEHLLFWRLGFYPSFHSEDVVEAIDRVLSDCEIKGAVLYEVFGIHDLLLRVWIPPTCSLEHFRQTLVDALDPHSLKTCDAFVVNEPVRHWLFPGGSPAEEIVATSTAADLEAIHRGEVDPVRLEELVGDGLLADFSDAHRLQSGEPSELPGDQELEADGKEEDGEKGLQTAVEVPQIKFAIVVVGQPELPVQKLNRFQKTVAKVLDGADKVAQRSLYAGFGFGHFLILGAVSPENFYAIDEELITGLNKEHIQEAYESRTYTYISGVRSYLIFREGLLKRDPETTPEDSDPSTVPEPHRFQLKEKLGEGGFSPVYWVYDAHEERDWAMKVFAPEHARAAKRELQALRRFEDPRIVRVFSLHEESSSGRSFLLMEYIEGDALDCLLADEQGIEDFQAIEIVTSVLDALIVIHPDQTQIDEIREKKELSADEFEREQMLQEQAVVHRDIKPANIVRLADGSIKLIDFNISSRPGDRVKTRSGTPRYLAPDATSDVWDVSVDLFATGVILYEMICGAHPYRNNEPRGDRRPTDPREYRSDLSPEFAQFLVKSCMPRRTERFKTAKEMRAALVVATERAL